MLVQGPSTSTGLERYHALPRKTEHTNNGHHVNLVHGTGQSAQETDDQTDDTKNQGASAMVRKNIHQNVKHEDVARHEEDQEQQLANSKQFTAKAAHQELAGITHTVNVRVAELELPNLIARVPGQSRDENNHDSSTI